MWLFLLALLVPCSSTLNYLDLPMTLTLSDESSSLPKVVLNDGTQFPVVSLGTAGYNDTIVPDAMINAGSIGLLAFDTAFNYHNQKGVGEGIRKLVASGYERSQLYVTTKVSPCMHPTMPSYNITDPIICEKQTLSDLRSDLAQLGLEYIDMVLLHGPSHHGAGECNDLSNALNMAQWNALQTLRSHGKFVSIGVSNYCASCLAPLLTNPSTTTPPAINQIAFHVGTGADPGKVVSWCKAHGIVVQAYSPLASGQLITDPLVTKVATHYPSYSPAQVALRWIVQQGLVLTAKAFSSKYLDEDIDIFKVPLTAADMSLLTEANTPSQPYSWGCTK